MPSDNNGIFVRLPSLEIRYGQGCALAYHLHAHDTYSLGLVLAGATGYQCGQRHYRLGAGDALCLAPYTPHACNPEGGVWRYLMCQIDAGLWPQDVVADGAPLRDGALNAALLALWHQARCGAEVAMAWQRVAAVLQQVQGRAQAAEKWREMLAMLPTDGESVAAWAASAAVSPRQLARLLAPSGMSPHQWLLNRRINRGKALLCEGRTLAEVALATGFADQAHFQRQFKRLTAVTPGQYRGVNEKG
ncbi:MAG: AraC family transcriptional regulator [Cardiobacteriaceae bacterium]|nr:AraC family transcriptional regulator [Cardiobacteriaceae bacterium]